MKKSDRKILEEINAVAWAKFGDKLFVEKPIAPIASDLIEKGLKDRDKLTPEQVEKLETWKAMGMFEGTHRVEDEEVAKQITDFVEEQIALAIKEGRLTDPNKEKHVRKSKQLTNRTKRIKSGDNKDSEGSDS